MSAAPIINETKNVPFNQIAPGDDENARSGELEDIPGLAENIRTHGLLENLVVTNGGTGEKLYKVVAGNRRYAALKLLKWGDKPVPVTVVPSEGRAIKNLAENIHRKEVKTADLAQRLHDLSTGDYPLEKGEKKVIYTKEELAAQLGLSVSHVTNLIRAHVNLAPAVRKAWQKDDLPQNLVFKAAGMTEKVEEEVKVLNENGKPIPVKDEEGKNVKDDEGKQVFETKTVKKVVPDEKGQEKLLSNWEKKKELEALAQKGEKPAKPDASGGGGEGGDEVPKDGARPGKKALAEFMEKAKAKLKDYKDGSPEFISLKGKLDAVMWCAGKRDGLAPR